MAMIKCHECNNEISDQAKICPHCGYEHHPVEVISPSAMRTEIGNKNVNIVLGIVLIVLGLVGIIGGLLLLAFIIGIFGIIGGIVLIVFGSSKISGTHSCECPYCGYKSEIGSSALSFKCPTCKKLSTRKGAFLETVL